MGFRQKAPSGIPDDDAAIIAIGSSRARVGMTTSRRHALFHHRGETRKRAGGGRGRMDYDNCASLPAMFFEQADRLGDKPFLWMKRDRRYQPMTWATAARDVRRLAQGLRALGIGPGERVALVAENRPEWVIADLAIMSAGAITVPAYVTNTVEDHRHVFATSGARAVIVSKSSLSGTSAGSGQSGRHRANGDRDRANYGTGERGRRPVVGRGADARGRSAGQHFRANRPNWRLTTSPASSSPRAPAASPRG